MEESSRTSTNNIQKIGSGGITIFAGHFGAMALQFVIGIIVVRSVTRYEYGLISLANTFTTMLVILSVLGLGAGAPKLIAQYRKHDQHSTVNHIMGTSVYIVAGVSLFLSFLFYQ